MKILKNTVIALGNKKQRNRFLYHSENVSTEIEKAPLVSEVETAMNSTVRSGTKSKEAFVLLSVLEKKYGSDYGILSAKEKREGVATIGRNGTKYLKKFQKEEVAYFKDNNITPDGIASPHKSTWRAILLEAKKQSARSHVVKRVQKKEKELQAEIEREVSVDQIQKIKSAQEVKNNYHKINIPDWFVNAENDAVRVATFNALSRGSEQFARRSDGGGNEAKIVRALKSIHPKAFSGAVFSGHKEGDVLKVDTDQLAKALPGLNPQDYKRILVLLEQVSEGVVSEQGEELEKAFNSTGETRGRRIENDSLTSKKLLVDTFWGDKPLEVEVLDNKKYKVSLVTNKGRMAHEFSRANLDKLVKGETVPSGKNGMVLAQAQGKVFELKEEKADVHRFVGEDGRDINIDQKLLYGKTLGLNDGGLNFPKEMTKDDALRIISKSVHYLVNMLDYDTLHDCMRVNEDGKIYLTANKVGPTGESVIGKILQKVLNDSEEGLEYRMEGGGEAGKTRSYRYRGNDEKINALTHKAGEKLVEEDPVKKIIWKINGITNTDWDRNIEGTTVREKLKFFGITISDVERELSRDEFVANGANTDSFKLFERKMNTALLTLVEDGVITGNSENYQAFEDELVRRGKVQWEAMRDDSFFGKLFREDPEGDVLRNIQFRMGVCSLFEKSRKEGTYDLTTELRMLYEGKDSEVKGYKNTVGLNETTEQQGVFNALNIASQNINDVFKEGANGAVFADLAGSNIKIGFGVSGLERGSGRVQGEQRQLIDTQVENFVSSAIEINSDTTTTHGGWKDTVIKWEKEEKLPDGSTKITEYERTVSVRVNEDKTVTIVEVDTDITNKETKTYKITKYKKNNPKKRFHCTIDARQNLATIEALPGLDLSADAGIGADLMRLGDTAYASLHLGADAQLTEKVDLSVDIGQKLKKGGELSSSLSSTLSYQANEHWKVFTGLSSNSLGAFTESMGLDTDRLQASIGATYTDELSDWDKTVKLSAGEAYLKIEGLLKRNKESFLRDLKEAVNSVSDEKADQLNHEIYGEDVDVTPYRKEAKFRLGTVAFSQALRGSLTKFGASFTALESDRILALVFGFATGADVINQVSPHEVGAHEQYRASLQKMGDYVKTLRHSETVALDALKNDDGSYDVLKNNNDISGVLGRNLANGKYVEVNVYVDPSYKDNITVNKNGTFTLKNGVKISPFVLNKNLTGGNTEINVYLGDYKAGAFDSAICMSSGRLNAMNADGALNLKEKLNTGTEGKRRDIVQKRIRQKAYSLQSIETEVFNKMKEDEGIYKVVCGIEDKFKNLESVGTNNQKFIDRINELKDLGYDDKIVRRFSTAFKKLADNTTLLPHQMIASLVKARMKYDAEKVYGEDFETVKKSNEYAKILKRKKEYAKKYNDKWRDAMKTLGVNNLSQLGDFTNPETALKDVSDADKGENPTVVTGGIGYIMAKKGMPVVLNQVNKTEIMHANVLDPIQTENGRFRIIAGYLRECRNPTFIIQEIPSETATGAAEATYTSVSDSEGTVSRKGLLVHSIDFALGVRFSPPTVSRTVAYEKVTITDEQTKSETKEDRSIREWQEEKEETITKIKIIPPETPEPPEDDCDPLDADFNDVPDSSADTTFLL